MNRHLDELVEFVHWEIITGRAEHFIPDTLKRTIQPGHNAVRKAVYEEGSGYRIGLLC